MSKERVIRRTAVTLAETTRLWRPEIEGNEHLVSAREHLKKGSVVAISNHPFKGDLIYPLVACLKVLGDNIQHLIMPADQSQFDLGRILKSFGHKAGSNRSNSWERLGNCLAFRIGAKLIKVELIPIIKEADIGYHGWKAARASWENLLSRGKTILQKPGTLMIIFPEGERSLDSSLQPVKRGVIDLLEKGGENCLCLPLGVHLDGQSQRLNVKRKVIVCAGPLFTLGDLITDRPLKMNSLQKKQAAEILMKNHLVPLLPQKRQEI